MTTLDTIAKRCEYKRYIPKLISLIMAGRWHVTLSQEVADWYASLPTGEFAQAQRAIEKLAEHGTGLGMPHGRYLQDTLWELRFRCGRNNQRITFTADPGRNIITLATFRKQRSNESTEVRRARNALQRHPRKAAP